jgi:hypothetical protein
MVFALPLGASAPYCPSLDAAAPRSCLEIPREQEVKIFLVTDDPNARARNAEFLISQTQPTCP